MHEALGLTPSDNDLNRVVVGLCQAYRVDAALAAVELNAATCATVSAPTWAELKEVTWVVDRIDIPDAVMPWI